MKHGKSSRLALFGYPLSYSLSPQIHNFFARQQALELTYELCSVTRSTLFARIQEFVQAGGRGFNVTTPYKQEVYQQLNAATRAAELAGAVNTVKILADGTLYGENTDGDGLLLDLQEQKITLKNQTILILGAGGAAGGILNMLCQQQPAQITLVNRNIAKALQLQAKFKNLASIEVITYSQLAKMRPNIIINTLIPPAVSELWPQLHQLQFIATDCYDLNYNLATTDFMRLALIHGARRVCNGLGMLVQQAAKSFYFWHGIYPDITGILPYLQRYLRQNSN